MTTYSDILAKSYNGFEVPRDVPMFYYDRTRYGLQSSLRGDGTFKIYVRGLKDAADLKAVQDELTKLMRGAGSENAFVEFEHIDVCSGKVSPAFVATVDDDAKTKVEAAIRAMNKALYASEKRPAFSGRSYSKSRTSIFDDPWYNRPVREWDRPRF